MSEPEGNQETAVVAPVVGEVGVDVICDRGWRDRADGGDPAYRVLLASVRSRGVLVPLVVRAHPEGGYQLVSGARRLQAARETGCSVVPVVVRELGDAEALVGGAWAALTRSGIDEDEGARLRAELLAAGVPDDDAELLAGSLPRGGEGVELTGRAAADEPETPAPAWAWGTAAPGTAEPRRGRHRFGKRSGR